MPMYEYQCGVCSRTFEEIRSFSDAEKATCPGPDCGAEATRTITAPGGYYINGDNSASRRPKGAGSFRKAGK